MRSSRPSGRSGASTSTGRSGLGSVLGLSDEEAGAVLGVKPGVRVRVWRALGRLRRELGEEVKQLCRGAAYLYEISSSSEPSGSRK